MTPSSGWCVACSLGPIESRRGSTATESISSRMLEREVTVTNRAGLHTRPASMIVRTAAKFDSSFFIHKDGYEINGKSIIGVMTLAAEQGARLTLVLDGADEDAAADALVQLFDEGFGEVKVRKYGEKLVSFLQQVFVS